MKHWLSAILAFAVILDSRAAETNAPAAPAPVAPQVSTPAPTNAVVPKAAAPAAKKTVKKKTKAPAKKPAAASKKATTAKTNTVANAESNVLINPPETGVVKDVAVNVRGQASFVGEVVTKLKKGETVSLLEEINLKKAKKDEPKKWYRIAMPANTPVWVFSDYINATNKSVIPKKLNARSGHGENYSVVAVLHKGDVVKEIRRSGEWIEIETPANTYAFVAADLIERQTPVAPVATPTVAAVEPVKPEAVVVPTEPAPKPIEAAPQPVVAAPPAVVVPEPAPVTPQEVLTRRIVKREGIVKQSVSIVAPTQFTLDSDDNGTVINYIHSPEVITPAPKQSKVGRFFSKPKPQSKPVYDLLPFFGKKVIITGEEMMDKRWPNTPVIEIETITAQ